MNAVLNSPSLLRITEIFYSLQGESVSVGIPTVFIRLTGCPLRCQYCDTSYAFHGGQKLSLDEILNKTQTFKTPYVCVTGGEPLAQPASLSLLSELCNADYNVSLETSGALDIQAVDPRVTIVLDLKTPDSLESEKNKWSNLDYLKKTDQIKFVICSRKDYEWAKTIIEEYQLPSKAHLLFSPSFKQMEPTTLADWIIEDQLPVRFQMQLHKLLWNDEPGR